jgi:hypothetical protein
MKFMSCIFHLIEAIPASFWGVVVGSFFSIGGIAITNRANDLRLRAQFEHEREQKTKDREMALRKEIYLDAVDAISAGMTAIGHFANLDLPDDKITNVYLEKSPAISKVHVIARTETVQALTSFTSQLVALFLTLSAQRSELRREKNTLALFDAQIAEFGKERDRILEMIKQYNIEGTVDKRRWTVLQGNFDFQQKQIKDFLERRAELVGALYPKQLEFMRDCAAGTVRLGEGLISVLSAVRAELELPLDELAYRQIVQSLLAEQQEAIDAFVQNLMPNAT